MTTPISADHQALVDAASAFLSIALAVTGDKRGMSMMLFLHAHGRNQFVAADVEFRRRAEAVAKLVGGKITWPKESAPKRRRKGGAS